MSYQLIYTDIIRILSERDETPVEMLALKTGSTSTDIIGFLQKLEKIHVVQLLDDKKKVRISNPHKIPTMTELYALAG